MALGDARLDGGIACRKKIAELIGEAREGAARGLGGELVQMDGDDAPGALNHELQEEGAECQLPDGLREGPERNDRQGEESGDDDRVAATEAFRPRAEEDAAQDGADVVDDGDGADGMARKLVLDLEEGRVEILRAVAEEVERGHQQDDIEEELPVLADGAE